MQNCSSLPLTLCRLNSQEFLNPKREVKHSTGNFWTRPAQKFPLSSPLPGHVSSWEDFQRSPHCSCVLAGPVTVRATAGGLPKGPDRKSPRPSAEEAGGGADLGGGPAPRGFWNATRQAVCLLCPSRCLVTLLGSKCIDSWQDYDVSSES